MSNSPRPKYPSDLSEHQWASLEPLMPPQPRGGRNRSISLRAVANAINYRWETGCSWRMLPHDFPHWGTVYSYFRAWQRTGVIRQFRALMLERRPNPPRRFHAPTDTGFDSPEERTANPPAPAFREPIRS